MKVLKGISTVFATLFLVLIVQLNAFAQDCECDITIDAADKPNPFINGDNTTVNPGDVICILGGTYTYIRIINIHGTAENPITIINCDGQVEIDLTGQGNHGFVLNNSTHVNVTGTGDPEVFYGFRIYNNPEDPARTGMAITTQISDVQLDHVEAHDVELGLHLINVPTCDEETWRDNWTMENVEVHDFYVHDTAKEGLYIGSSKYSEGHSLECGSILPPLIRHIKVYNNNFENNGWDAFQVSTAIEDCEIFNNVCKNFGLDNKSSQRAGIVVGGGSTGLVYNNFIESGEGDGIDIFGVGNVRVFNNVVIGAKGQGIFIGNREVLEAGYNHYIINNTIINSGEDNIRYNNEFAVGSHVVNNLSVNPGQKHINYVKEDATGVIDLTNIEYASVGDVGFIDPDNGNYSLLETSSAVNAGSDITLLSLLNIDLNFLNIDFNGNGRPGDGVYDVGAYEYTINNLPVVDNPIDDQSVVAGELFNFAFADNVFEDADGDSFTYSAKLSDGSDLPDWLTFTASTRTFNGTPPITTDETVLTIKVIANDGNGGTVSDEFQLTIEKSNLLKIGKSEEKIELFPNPTNSELKIKVNKQQLSGTKEATIYNMAGGLIRRFSITRATTTIDVAELDSGIYIISIISENESVVKSFIKQ